MKIAVLIYEIENLGGIINHTENLVQGLKDIGHDVDFYQLQWREKCHSQRTNVKDHVIGSTGLYVHQGNGWCFTKESRLPYKGAEAVKSTVDVLSGYDLLIWQVPVPTKKKANIGNTDWLGLYDAPVKQIAMIHDGNMSKLYPWISHISHRLTALACVHPCAYHSCSDLAVPRALILNPQDLSSLPSTPSYTDRMDGFLSCQISKGWKRVHEPVQAISYMPEKGSNELRAMAGGGLEYAYMMSPNKCKSAYFHKEDSKFGNVKMWDTALDNGMDWLGYISNETRDSILSGVKLLLDPSWSKRYSQVGDHFNRVVIDAIKFGAVPVARPLGISTNLEGNGEIFKSGVNYLSIPQDVSPQEYADYLVYYSNLPTQDAEQLRENGRLLLQLFDKNLIAEQIIKLSLGQPTGFYDKLEVGETSESLIARADEIFLKFFYNNES